MHEESEKGKGEKRRLQNREAARRCRSKVKCRITELEGMVAQLQTDKLELLNRLKELEQHNNQLALENRRLNILCSRNQGGPPNADSLESMQKRPQILFQQGNAPPPFPAVLPYDLPPSVPAVQVSTYDSDLLDFENERVREFKCEPGYLFFDNDNSGSGSDDLLDCHLPEPLAERNFSFGNDGLLSKFRVLEEPQNQNLPELVFHASPQIEQHSSSQVQKQKNDGVQIQQQPQQSQQQQPQQQQKQQQQQQQQRSQECIVHPISDTPLGPYHNYIKIDLGAQSMGYNSKKELLNVIDNRWSKCCSSLSEFPENSQSCLPATLPLSDTPRDWNSEFQELIDYPNHTPHDVHYRTARLNALFAAFTLEAEAVARVIVGELDSAKKSLTSLQVGGVMGGQKFRHGNILFKLPTPGQGIYQDVVHAHKSNSNELRAMAAVGRCQVRMLHTSLSCVVQVRGHAVFATAWNPLQGAESLVWGSGDAGTTFHDDQPAIKPLLQLVAENLNLAPHPFRPFQQSIPEATRKEIGYDQIVTLSLEDRKSDEKIIERTFTVWLAADVEGHLSKDDGRYYVVDLARLLPPDLPRLCRGYPLTGPAKDDHLYRVFRPEFVASNPIPLSSDAFSGWGRLQGGEYNDRVRAAFDRLVKEVVPRCVGLLTPGQPDDLDQLAAVKKVLHANGVNMRYLLLAFHYAWSQGLADFGNEVIDDSAAEMTEPEGPDEGEASSEEESKDEAEGPSMKALSVGFLLLTEILSRSMKALFRTCMRSICHPCDRPFILTGQFLIFLMCGEGSDSNWFWRELLPHQIAQQFDVAVFPAAAMYGTLFNSLIELRGILKEGLGERAEANFILRKVLSEMGLSSPMGLDSLAVSIRSAFRGNEDGEHLALKFQWRLTEKVKTLDIPPLLSPAQSADYLERELALRIQNMGPCHPSLATTLYAQMELFALWRDKDPQVMLSRAEEAIRGLLAILDAHPPSTIVDTAGPGITPKHSVHYSPTRLVACQVYGRAGLVYMKFHQRQKAMDYLVRAMTSAKREFGENEYYATAMNDMATFYVSDGNLEKGLTMVKTALALREKLLDPQHADIGSCCNTLGTLLQQTGDTTQAAQYLRRALAIQTAALGPRHPHVGTVLHNLGRILHDEKEFDKAETMYRQALGIQEFALPPTDISIATTLNNLATMICDSKKKLCPKWFEAVEFYRRCLFIKLGNHGLQHFGVGSNLAQLGKLYRNIYLQAATLKPAELSTFPAAIHQAAQLAFTSYVRAFQVMQLCYEPKDHAKLLGLLVPALLLGHAIWHQPQTPTTRTSRQNKKKKAKRNKQQLQFPVPHQKYLYLLSVLPADSPTCLALLQANTTLRRQFPDAFVKAELTAKDEQKWRSAMQSSGPVVAKLPPLEPTTTSPPSPPHA